MIERCPYCWAAQDITCRRGSVDSADFFRCRSCHKFFSVSREVESYHVSNWNAGVSTMSYRIDPDERRRRIMEAADADDWSKVKSEIRDAVELGLQKDLAAPIVRTRVVRTRKKIEADLSDGRTVFFDVRYSEDNGMLQAVCGMGTVWASAKLIEGLTDAIYGMAVGPEIPLEE